MQESHAEQLDEEEDELEADDDDPVVVAETLEGVLADVWVLVASVLDWSLSVWLSLFSELSGFSGSVPSGRLAGSMFDNPGGSMLNPGGQKDIPKKEGQPLPPDGGRMGLPKLGGPIIAPAVGRSGG